MNNHPMFNPKIQQSNPLDVNKRYRIIKNNSTHFMDCGNSLVVGELTTSSEFKQRFLDKGWKPVIDTQPVFEEFKESEISDEIKK